MKSIANTSVRLAILSAALLCAAQARASLCTDLAQTPFPNVEIQSAQDVAAGPFAPEGDRPLATEVPAFCRVTAVAHPVPNSSVLFELWLPAGKAWNHRLESFGSDNYGGVLPYPSLAEGLREGYAASSFASGFGSRNPGQSGVQSKGQEAINDWAYRGPHATAQAAKRIVAGYYGHGAEHAYFNGCGFGGGTQALSEAQQFPQDYDGILAGDAPPDRVRLNAGLLWDFMATHDANGAPLLDDAALRTLHAAAIAACDAKDGLKDGVLEQPQACRFDPKAVQCKGGPADGCLTPPQVEAARKLYAGPRVPGSKGKDAVLSGYAPGSEPGWKQAILDPKQPVSADFWRLWVEGKPAWDWHTFDLGRDVSLGEEKLAKINATEIDLNTYRQRGGKLLIYHGWADGVVPAGEAIDFFDALAHENPEELGKPESYLRLFLVPGMGYCGGGDGFALRGGMTLTGLKPTTGEGPRDATHDALSALDRWVTKGATPETLIVRRPAAAGAESPLLPLCAYPMTPRWDGKGDRNDVDSYQCLPMK